MFKKSRFVLICVIFFLICVISGYAQDETLTITTYYPSPYGVYREMRAQRMAIGDTYINHSVVCWRGDTNCDGSGEQTVIPPSAFDPDPNVDLIVQGNVGIGTTSPIGNIGLHLRTSRWDHTAAAGMVIQGVGASDNPGLMLFNSQDKEIGAFGGAVDPGQWSDEAQPGDITLKACNGRLMFSTSNVSVPPYPPASSNPFPARMIIDQTGNVGIGTTSPQFGKVQIESINIPLAFRETDQSGAGSLWRIPLDGKHLRFDASQNGTDFTPYVTPLDLYSDGKVVMGMSGNVGIGTTTPGTWKLRVAGGSAAVDTGQSWTTTSDARLKKDILPISQALTRTSQLQGVMYHTLEEREGDPKHLGLVAQEVEKIIPELVLTGEDGYKGLDYGRVSALLVEAIKELKAENDVLKEKIRTLEARLTKLEK